MYQTEREEIAKEEKRKIIVEDKSAHYWNNTFIPNYWDKRILADKRTPLQIVQIIGAPENITRACVRVLEVVQKELEKDENKE